MIFSATPASRRATAAADAAMILPMAVTFISFVSLRFLRLPLPITTPPAFDVMPHAAMLPCRLIDAAAAAFA